VSIIVGLLLFIAVVPGGLVYWWKERQAKHTQDEAASKKPAKKKPDPKKPKSVVKQVNEVNPKKPKEASTLSKAISRIQRSVLIDSK